MPYTPPEFRDHDRAYYVTAEKLEALGQQYAAAAADADDPDTEFGAAVARAVPVLRDASIAEQIADPSSETAAALKATISDTVTDEVAGPTSVRAAVVDVASGIAAAATNHARQLVRLGYEGISVGAASPKPAAGNALSGVPGARLMAATTLAHVAGTIRYHPFEVDATINMTQIRLEVTTAPTATCFLTVGIYSADALWQPLRLIQQNNVAVSAVGVVSVGFTAPKPLPRGRYLVAVAPERNMTLRAFSGGVSFAAANPGNGVTQYFEATTPYVTPLPELAPRWTSAPTGAAGGLHSVLFGWTAEAPALDAMFLLPDRQIVRGANLVLHHESWATFWADWAWDTDIRWQVDAARGVGANTIRVIGDVEAVLDGRITIAQYRARWRQLINYCSSLGMWVYACGGGPQPDPWYPIADITAVLVELGREINGDPWVMGLDIMQENYAWAMTNGPTVVPAIRAVCDKPLTFSIPRASVWDTDSAYAQNQLRSMVDFFDYHIYYEIAVSHVDTFWDLQNESKPLLFGEFGAPVSVGQAAQVTLYRGVRDAVRHTRADGRHVAGALQWAVRDQDADDSAKWGMFTVDKTERTYLTDVFRSFPQNR